MAGLVIGMCETGAWNVAGFGYASRHYGLPNVRQFAKCDEIVTVGVG
jgi:hypothetical protein